MFLKHHWKVDCIRFCVLLVERTEGNKSSSFPHAHDAVIASSNQERLVWVLSHCAHGPRVGVICSCYPLFVLQERHKSECNPLSTGVSETLPFPTDCLIPFLYGVFEIGWA